ncbi:MAG TPA: histidine ammonia-lyase, partial [Bacteroidetes bacterium]|nr:histidine ammonia-lyase [Bacteroidota bacterium]
NSMGSISAQKAWRVLMNTRTVLAIELLCSCQGLDFARRINGAATMKAGRGVEAAYRFVRRRISHMHQDRVLFVDIQKAIKLTLESGLMSHVEDVVGPLA